MCNSKKLFDGSKFSQNENHTQKKMEHKDIAVMSIKAISTIIVRAKMFFEPKKQ